MCLIIDYTGAVLCRNIFISGIVSEEELFKCYIVVSACATTTGIVLDLVQDVSAQTWIHSFERFTSRRGCLQVVLSDNESPFIASSTE